MRREIIVWIAVGAITTTLILLAGWYFFIRNQENQLTRVFEGRGFEATLPEGSGVGSTGFNLVSVFSSPTIADADPSATNTNTPSRLWRVSVIPSVGLQFFGSELYYAEQPTGHVFKANPETGAVERLSATLLPRVTDVVWVATSSLIVQQTPSLEETSYFAGRIETATTTSGGSLVGEYLPKDVFVVAPAGESAFMYGVRAGSSAAFIERTISGGEKRVWTNPLSHWIIRPTGAGYVFVEPPSSVALGSAFMFSQNTLVPLVQNAYGLMVSRFGDLFSETRSGTPVLFTFKDGARTDLPFVTFAEKCVRDPGKTTRVYCAVPTEFPKQRDSVDAWYRGEVHTSDRWFALDTETNVSELVLSPEGEYGVPLDASDVTISRDGLYLAFIDTITSTPWVLRVRE